MHRNLLQGATHTLFGDIGSWTATGATLSPSTKHHRYEMGTSIMVEPDGTGDITMTTGAVEGAEWIGEPVRGFVWFKAPTSIEVEISVCGGDPVERHPGDPEVHAVGRWVLVQADGPMLGNATERRLDLTIRNHGGTTFYVSNPVIYPLNAVRFNRFAAEVWMRLPEHMREADAEQENPDYPLLRFLDVILREANDIYEMWDGLRYLPEDHATPEGSSLTTPADMGIEEVRWIAQLLGVALRDPTTNYATWRSLEEALAPTGDPFWTDWETDPDADSSGTVTWLEIESFAPVNADIMPYLQWQIEEGRYGLHGGTLSAIESAARQVLSDTQQVEVVERHGGDPWVFRIETLASETPEVSGTGQSSPRLLAYVQPAVPAGFQVVHTTV